MGSRLPRQQEWMAGCQGRVPGSALAVTPPEKSFWMSSWASIDLSSLCPLALSQTGLMSQTLIEFKAAFFLPPDQDFYLVSHHTNSSSRRQRPSHFLGRPSTQVLPTNSKPKSSSNHLKPQVTSPLYATPSKMAYYLVLLLFCAFFVYNIDAAPSSLDSSDREKNCEECVYAITHITFALEENMRQKWLDGYGYGDESSAINGELKKWCLGENRFHNPSLEEIDDKVPFCMETLPDQHAFHMRIIKNGERCRHLGNGNFFCPRIDETVQKEKICNHVC
ncbi:hypothetical protein DdX_15106 [Ditylenchus destructor]|uniref:Uncharacterized protein n=1 Tax=Ditylenchus destructor TaxID=166010 RepID=A0AAD4QV13_9BILA|nr:hypothetical protein DdX_15106 [Ditylenchus destructor]